MKSQYRSLFAFLTLLAIVSLACAGGSSTSVAPPTNSPPQPTSAPQNTNPTPQSGGTSDIVTFTDQSNLLSFELPGDWTYEHTEHGDKIYSDANAYSDTFTSPDQSAKIESLVILANNTVNNSVSAGAALDILNTYYSNTGKNNGDIRISSDQIQKDGSERFQWVSKGGGYSGVSFFEVRGADKKTWLMLTAWWLNETDQAVIDQIDSAISSYNVPQ